MKKRFRLGLALLLVGLTFAALTLCASAETKTGTCGDDVTYTLDTDTGVLTISGDGEMKDWGTAPGKMAPWYNYRTSIHTVIISNNVTSIGNWAFSGCSSLTSITIPDSVTSIGNYAFYFCSTLTSITIGNCVASIGESAFGYCSGLTSVIISDSVTSIGKDVFQHCSNLTKISIGGGVMSIGSSAFFWCENLEEVYITDLEAWCKILFDGGSAANPLSYANKFYLNGELVTDLVIPDGVMSIGDSAFYGCRSLTRIAIPSSLTRIGNFAFGSCRNLANITIPDGVASIGDSAFNYCSNLTNITVLNPNCQIYDSVNTISSTATIYGFVGSTAEVYATDYNRTFVALDPTSLTAKVSAATYASGTATLRVTATPTVTEGMEVERYGVFFAPAKYADSYATNGQVVVKEGTIESGKPFVADLTDIPESAYDVKIYAWAFVKLVGVSDLVVCPLDPVSIHDIVK